MSLSGARGKIIHEKHLKRISSWHCLFEQGDFKLGGRRSHAFLQSSGSLVYLAAPIKGGFAVQYRDCEFTLSHFFDKFAQINHPFHQDGTEFYQGR